MREAQINKIGNCLRQLLSIEITEEQLKDSYKNRSFNWVKKMNPKCQVISTWFQN
jgi:hypothetical protein